MTTMTPETFNPQRSREEHQEAFHALAPWSEEDAWWEFGGGREEMESELAAERAAERFWEERGRVDDGFDEWEARRVFL